MSATAVRVDAGAAPSGARALLKTFAAMVSPRRQPLVRSWYVELQLGKALAWGVPFAGERTGAARVVDARRLGGQDRARCPVSCPRPSPPRSSCGARALSQRTATPHTAQPPSAQAAQKGRPRVTLLFISLMLINGKANKAKA